MKKIDAALASARAKTKRDVDDKLQRGLSIATVEDGQLVSCQIVETVVSASVASRKGKAFSLPTIRREAVNNIRLAPVFLSSC